MKLNIKNKFLFIRTIAALLVLLTVMGVVTYSWTIGIEELSIDNGFITAPIPSSVNSAIKLDGTEHQEIDLTDFDQLSHDGMCFSEVISTDGVSFKIPNGENSFRDANTNDVGEKYIKFDFEVKLEDECSLRFAEIPTFTIKNNNYATVYDANTSAFRIMIGEVSTSSNQIISSKIFTTGANKNGAKNLDTFGVNQDILTFNDNAYPSVHRIIISVWLDADSVKSEDNLLGNKVSLSLKLKAYSNKKKTIIFAEERIGYDVGYGYYAYVPNYNKNIHGDKMNYDFENGCYRYEFITEDTGNFSFILANNNNNNSPRQTGEIGGRYLIKADNTWIKLGSNDIIVSTKVGDTGEGGTVYIDEVGNTSVNAYYTEHTIYATSAQGYRFAGWYSEPTCNSIPVSGKAEYTFRAYPGYYNVFYAKFEPVPSYDITFTAVTYSGTTKHTNGFDGGYYYFDYDRDGIGDAGYGYTEVFPMSSAVAFEVYADPYVNNGYEFAGWYADSNCTEKITDQLLLTYQPTESTTFYAKFVKAPMITVYFTNVNKWNNVYCHYWGGSSSTAFPGIKLDKCEVNEYSQDIYKATIPSNTTGIVFSCGNNTAQTIDIVSSDISDNIGFYLTGATDDKGHWNYGTWIHS